MATWNEIREGLARYRVVSVEGESALVICAPPGCPPWPVELRAVHAHDADWLQLDGLLCKVGEVSLENILRESASAVLGAVVIAGGECRLRERALLGPLDPADLDALLALVIDRTADLRARCCAGRSRVALAD